MNIFNINILDFSPKLCSHPAQLSDYGEGQRYLIQNIVEPNHHRWKLGDKLRAYFNGGLWTLNNDSHMNERRTYGLDHMNLTTFGCGFSYDMKLLPVLKRV